MTSTSQRAKNVKAIDLYLKAGRPFFLAGPMGSGKTALVLERTAALGLTPILFEACPEGASLPEDHVVLIENFLGLDADTQNEICNMLRSPAEVKLTPRMEQLRQARLVIMHSSPLTRDFGRRAFSSSGLTPSPAPLDFLQQALPFLENHFEPEPWLAWATRKGICPALMEFTLGFDRAMWTADTHYYISPRAIEQIDSLIKDLGKTPDEEDVRNIFDSFFLADISEEMAQGYLNLRKSIADLDLEALAQMPDPQQAATRSGPRPLVVPLALAATESTVRAFAERVMLAGADLRAFEAIVTARGQMRRSDFDPAR